ncbi:MAG: hypothetical protein L0Y58_22560 [Verrucomicrobia subdivision 3 bacterium]|nr:hypothetical protein [Limisphaerales bacterium]
MNATSRSGQFAVRGLPFSKPLANLAPTSAVSYVRLDPMLLAVSAETVKQALLFALDLRDQWEGGILVTLHPVEKDGEEIVVASVRYADGWRYRMDIPELVDRRRLIDSIVEVLLLEMAHRGAGERRLELPPWLVPGLAAHLISNTPERLILEPASFTLKKTKFKEELAALREKLRAGAGITLDELNWPDSRTDPNAYEAAAHLFVRELLRREGGPRAFASMLSQLRNHLNWHIAFLRGFGFASLREADKWWTLSLMQFAGRDSLALWSPAEVRAQLESILATPVQVRHTTNQLPVTINVPLQRILQEWPLTEQPALLRQKLQHLEALRLRSPQPVVELVNEYHKILSDYLAARGRTSAGKAQAPASTKLLLTETIRKLDECDLRKDAMSLTPPGTPVLSNSVRK